MNINFMKKVSMLLGVFMFAMSFILVSNTYAASVGSRLTSPEAGWKRYDDINPAIKYEGRGWERITNDPNTYASTGTFTRLSGPTSNAIKIKFSGTKLRIIDLHWDNRVDNVNIEIDGEISTYNPNNKKNKYQVVVFEALDLPPGVHEVKLTTNSTSNIFSLDAIDIDADGALLDPYTPDHLGAIPGDGQVTLNWDEIQAADRYTIRYGTESGKYTNTVSVTKDAYGSFVVPDLTNETTYHFVVTSVVDGKESARSMEATATPHGVEQPSPEPEQPTDPTGPAQPSGDRAILVVTMTTGLEKEFDLSMKEVNDFIAWYEAKEAGSGKASYAINKHDHNKGPFSSRKDYILYDRVLTFEVSEY